MPNENASNSIDQAQKGVTNVDAKEQDRCYNPIDQAPRGNVSASLNSDSARYKKGPGPV